MSDSKALTYDDDNIFAKILRGELPCSKVYEDADTFGVGGGDEAVPVPVLAPQGHEDAAFAGVDLAAVKGQIVGPFAFRDRRADQFSTGQCLDFLQVVLDLCHP